MLQRIAEGGTDLVFDYLAEGHSPSSKKSDGDSLMQCCRLAMNVKVPAVYCCIRLL